MDPITRPLYNPDVYAAQEIKSREDASRQQPGFVWNTFFPFDNLSEEDRDKLFLRGAAWAYKYGAVQ